MKIRCGNCAEELNKEEINNTNRYELKGKGTSRLCFDCAENYILDTREIHQYDDSDDDVDEVNTHIQTAYECEMCYTELTPCGNLTGCVAGELFRFYCSDCEEYKVVRLEPIEM